MIDESKWEYGYFASGKPKPPCGRRLREHDYGRKCHVCQSSLKKVWLFFRTDRCIQPECPNYFGKRTGGTISYE